MSEMERIKLKFKEAKNRNISFERILARLHEQNPGRSADETLSEWSEPEIVRAVDSLIQDIQ